MAQRRILVVEDDLLNRMFYCEVLQRRGFTVSEVDDGALAMKRAREFRPDLVMMDINLPHVSGVDLIEQLKADPQLSKVPVLAITAYVGKIDRETVNEAGAQAFLAKPVTIAELTGAIDRLLAETGA